MSLNVTFSDDELPEVQTVINRACNTWEAVHVPQWVWQLEAAVVARLNDLKNGAPRDENPPPGS